MFISLCYKQLFEKILYEIISFLNNYNNNNNNNDNDNKMPRNNNNNNNSNNNNNNNSNNNSNDNKMPRNKRVKQFRYCEAVLVHETYDEHDYDRSYKSYEQPYGPNYNPAYYCRSCKDHGCKKCNDQWATESAYYPSSSNSGGGYGGGSSSGYGGSSSGYGGGSYSSYNR